MTMPIDTIRTLTEKEKQTLRLIVRGHDAKSIARSLDLSVHTINERLRDARRKMAVSSSREAARLLLEVESTPTPDLLVHDEIGEDERARRADHDGALPSGVGPASRHPLILVGAILMTLVLGILAVIALPQTDATPPPTSNAASTTPDPAVVDAARRWLDLVDQGRWDESYQGTGTSFRRLNTAQTWATVSQKVRVPLGAVIARTVIGQENLPAPPHGYEVVKFRTRFANRAEAIETVTLDREEGDWRVVGVTIG